MHGGDAFAMELAMSKENIQPLRGGRNAAQLEVGLQAQRNPQYQEQLMLQKQQYENAIRNYTGDDPLENYYQYIYWVEQSFPKHGHECNLIPLLEDCLGRFENDANYQNDLRFCKLWIKYIDMQYNHTELYQLLYAKRICIGCADLYKAWAYYYEAAGDIKRADQVYKLGKAELAQPFVELEAAYFNFIYGAGVRAVNNGAADPVRLAEQRVALTCLRPVKHGDVGSMRVPSASGNARNMLPMQQPFGNDNNRTAAAPVNVHEDYKDILLGCGAGAAPASLSILGAVKRDAPKENMMAAGVWTGAVKKTHVVHKTSNIPVHIDAPCPPHELGIQLPSTYVPCTRENFDNWQVPLCLPEPEEPNQIRMYPKALCYPDKDHGKEFSIEEVRARRYRKGTTSANNSASLRMETMDCADTSTSYSNAQMMQPPPHSYLHQQQHQQQQQHLHHIQSSVNSIIPAPVPSSVAAPDHSSTPVPSVCVSQYVSPPRTSQQYQNQPYQTQTMYNHQQPPQQQHQSPMLHHSMNHHQQSLLHHEQQHQQQQQQTPSTHYSITNNSGMYQHQSYRVSAMPQHPSPYRANTSYDQHSIGMMTQNHQQPQQQQPQNHHAYSHHSPMMLPLSHQLQSPHHQSYHQHPQQPPPQPQASPHLMRMHDTYNEPKTYTNATLQSPQGHTSYQLPSGIRTLGDTLAAQDPDMESPGAFNANSFWEKESPVLPRHGEPNFAPYTDSPASNWYQPQIEPKGNTMKTPFKMLSDDELAETGSRGGLDYAAVAHPTEGAKRVFEDEDLAANTEMFNLNAMHVSTPQNKQGNENSPTALELKSTKKRLFTLSDIMEEGSNIQSSASTGCSSAASAAGGRFGSAAKPIQMESIKEHSNYHFNLSQNMKANAELRLKLGMDCDSAPESPTAQAATTTTTPYENYYPVEQLQDRQEVEVEDDVPQKYTPYPVLNIQPTDPFTNSVLETFLEHVKFPGRHRHCMLRINGVPKLAIKKELCHVGNDRYLVDKLLGKGTYGSVYKGTKINTGEVVALKIQKPPNKWEFYICKEIQARLENHPLRDCFMDVHLAYFSDLASVLVSDVHHCSLLTLINTINVNLNNGPKHHLAIHLTSEMMKIVQALHQVKIIHADIKPDNFLVMTAQDTIRLQLIDFGCSIDMSLMPEGTMFRRKVKTESFECCEMKDDRPWSYHTDLFCIAATSHALLFKDYIEIKKTDGRWSIAKKIPRYYRDELWSEFFNSMLNMQEGLANLDYLTEMFANALDARELRTATTFISNSFKNR